jgi:hypothetical protein
MKTRKREMCDCDPDIWASAKRLAHEQGVYLNRYLEKAVAFYNGTMERGLGNVSGTFLSIGGEYRIRLLVLT